MNQPHETLDPIDWQHVEDVGVSILKDMLAYQQSINQRPVWSPVPAATRKYYTSPPPLEGEAVEDVFEELKTHLFPYPEGNVSPRFFGWVEGNGNAIGMIAEMIAAGFNTDNGGGEQAATYMELQVIDWFRSLMGMPKSTGGILVNGASTANLAGLLVARHYKSPNIRKEGVGNTRYRIYGSIEAHSSLKKACGIIGIGEDNFVEIQVNELYQINLELLVKKINEDRALGYTPMAVVGCAASVNTGSIDDLEEIANICQAEGLWMHVDGAFGALVVLSPKLKHLVKGLERADSVAFDMHKWLHMPYDIACVLIRDRSLQLQAFTMTPDYLSLPTRGITATGYWFGDLGIDLSRGFKALKAWLSIKTFGLEKYGKLIMQNMQQARYVTDQVLQIPELELMAPLFLNIICFRYTVSGLIEEQLHAFNQELILRLQEGGRVFMTSTRLHGKFAIRMAITNHRTTLNDLDISLAEVVRIGNDLVKQKWLETSLKIMSRNSS